MHENQGCYWLIDLFKEAKQVILISDKFPHTLYPNHPQPICLTMVWSVAYMLTSTQSFGSLSCGGYFYKCVTGGWSPVSTLQLFTYKRCLVRHLLYFILFYCTLLLRRIKHNYCFVAYFLFAFLFSLILISGCHFATGAAACLGKKELYLQNQKQLFEHKHEEDAECSDDTLTHRPWQ